MRNTDTVVGLSKVALTDRAYLDASLCIGVSISSIHIETVLHAGVVAILSIHLHTVDLRTVSNTITSTIVPIAIGRTHRDAILRMRVSPSSIAQASADTSPGAILIIGVIGTMSDAGAR